MGPEVTELEALLADCVAVRHGIGVSAATDTLLIAILALGLGPGAAATATPFTFIAKGDVFALLGAKPVSSTSARA